MIGVVGTVLAAALWLWTAHWRVDSRGSDEPEDASPQAYKTFEFLNEPEKGVEETTYEDDTPVSPEAQAAATRVLIEPGEPPDDAPGWVLLVDGEGQPVAADLLLGAPGMWPFETYTSSVDGWVRLTPAEVLTFANQPVRTYEVLARTSGRDEPITYWGEVSVSTDRAPTALQLEPSSDLVVTIHDEEGKPVEGASLRLARSSVGLLSLTTTSDGEGKGTFTRLNPGDYTLAVSASGFRRTEVTVTHGGDEPPIVSLEAGRGGRIFEAWRGPPGMGPGAPVGGEGSANRAVSESPQESGADDNLDNPPALPSARGDLKVFAVDPYGGPVHGAWVEVWAGGRLVSSGLTSGSNPLLMEVSLPFDGQVLAIHAGWGEGSARAVLNAEGGEDLVLSLENPLLSQTVGHGRLDDLDVIEALLGATLVEDGQKLLIDATDPDSAAIRAGVQRGDNLMSIRKAGAGHEMVIERGGRVQRLALR